MTISRDSIGALLIGVALSASIIYTSVPDHITTSKAEPYAMMAYNTAIHKHQVKNNKLIIVDFSLPSTQKRLWIIDMNTHKVILNTWVAHGSNSGNGIYATNFSNKDGSHKSSIGTFETLGTYYGKHGKSVQINGLEPGYNDNAKSRGVVVHGATYIGYGKTGHTWGCFGVPQSQSEYIVDTIKNGAIIFAYFPDKNYISSSIYVNGKY